MINEIKFLLQQQKLPVTTSLVSNSSFASFAPHALKGQKLLAQGIALGMMPISKTPCKGKSFIFCLEF